jgi:hypothetical protein
MTETTDEIIETAEHRAAFGLDPQAIAEGIIDGLKERRDGETAPDCSVLVKLDARIGEMDAQAAERDHPKLKKGAEQLRKAVEIVRQMADLADEGAQERLTDLAEKIRVCIRKSDNLAITAGQHLREARERCRAIGLDFNKWCAQADLGIKRSRIYQLMGPDPIAALRRDENNNEEPENVQSTDVAQVTNVERQSVSDQVIDSLKAHIQQWWMKASWADRLALGRWFDDLRQPETVDAEPVEVSEAAD